MTWNEKLKRWSKKYRGKEYVVSCLQLKCPANKIESALPAMNWWAQKKQEIDTGTTLPATEEEWDAYFARGYALLAEVDALLAK